MSGTRDANLTEPAGNLSIRAVRRHTETMAGGPWPEEARGRRSALIVACSDYLDPGLSELRAPAADAAALAAVLSDPKIGGFEVRTLLNEPAHVVNEAVEDFLRAWHPQMKRTTFRYALEAMPPQKRSELMALGRGVLT